MSSIPDPYLALNVAPTATAVDIKRAFRTLSLQYHPDRPGGDAAAFIRINDAYAILGDAELRAAHDRRESASADIFGAHMSSEHADILMQMFQNRLFAAFARGGLPEPVEHTIHLTIQELYDGHPAKIVVVNDEQFHISIPRGTRDGELFVIPGGGTSFDDVHFGNLHLIVRALPDPELSQRGMDLVVSKSITLKDALCGCSFTIKHPSNTPVRIDTVSIPLIIRPGFVKTVKGLGFCRDLSVGDLIIEISVVFPETLTSTQRELLSTAFECHQ